MAKVMREVYVCDICGEDADGNWHRVEYCNNEVVGEYGAPIFLCKEHASKFSIYADEFEVERYDNPTSEQTLERLIELMKADDNQ